MLGRVSERGQSLIELIVALGVGVAIDSQNNIYVSDSNNNRVLKFDF